MNLDKLQLPRLQLFRLSLLSLLVMSVPACRDKCSNITVVYDTYSQALVYPEKFDSYVQENEVLFNQDFFECIAAKERRISTIVAELEQQCDDAHIMGSEFWNQCYDVAAQEGGAGVLAGLLGIREVTQHSKSFDETIIGEYLLIVKFYGFDSPEEYENFMTQIAGFLESSLECEKCERDTWVFWHGSPEYE